MNMGAASKAAMFCPKNNYSSPEVVFVPSTSANIQAINKTPILYCFTYSFLLIFLHGCYFNTENKNFYV